MLTALAVPSVAMVALLFVLPGIASALPESWRHPVNEFWPTEAGSQLANVYPPPTPSSPGQASA